MSPKDSENLKGLGVQHLCSEVHRGVWAWIFGVQGA